MLNQSDYRYKKLDIIGLKTWSNEVLTFSTPCLRKKKKKFQNVGPLQKRFILQVFYRLVRL